MKNATWLILMSAAFFFVGLLVGGWFVAAGDGADRAAASWINQAGILVNTSGEARTAVEASELSIANFAALTSSVGANFDKLDPQIQLQIQKQAAIIENGVGLSIFEGQEVASSEDLIGIVACMSTKEVSNEISVADCAAAIVEK